MSEKEYGKIEQPYDDCWIGIDQSYTGFGLTVITNNLEYSTVVRKFTGRGVRRMEEIYVWLADKVEVPKVRRVAMEAPVRSSYSALMNGELSAIVQMAVWDSLELECVQVAPASLKKYVTGKGNAYDKNLILLKTFQKWGVEFDNDNAADSYGIARVAAQLADTDYERQVIEKVFSLE
jgi:Holliday junction resolvasome RuvABC endonuclease subunit